MDSVEFELKALRAEIMNKLDWTIKIQLSMCAAVSVILAYLLSANPDNISRYSFLTILCITVPCHIINQDIHLGMYKIAAYLIMFHKDFKWEQRIIDFGSRCNLSMGYTSKCLSHVDSTTVFPKVLSFISIIIFCTYPSIELKYILVGILLAFILCLVIRNTRPKHLKEMYKQIWQTIE